MSGDLPPWTRGDLSIPAALLEAIEAHAREAYPVDALLGSRTEFVQGCPPFFIAFRV